MRVRKSIIIIISCVMTFIDEIFLYYVRVYLRVITHVSIEHLSAIWFDATFDNKDIPRVYFGTWIREINIQVYRRYIPARLSKLFQFSFKMCFLLLKFISPRSMDTRTSNPPSSLLRRSIILVSPLLPKKKKEENTHTTQNFPKSF